MIPKQWALKVCIVVVMFFLSSCAFLFQVPSELMVNTRPRNIKVLLTNLTTKKVVEYRSPVKIPLDKRFEYTVSIETPNFKSRVYKIERRLNNWFLGNFVLGPVFFLGMAMDFASNSMWEHNQQNIEINFRDQVYMPDTFELNLPLEVVAQNGEKNTKVVAIIFDRK